MHLDRQAISAWADREHERLHQGVYLLWVDEGDSVDTGRDIGANIFGPAIVELVVYRDAGWTARERDYVTPMAVIAHQDFP